MKRTLIRLVTTSVLLAIPLVAGACGDDGDDAGGASDTTVTVVAENTQFDPDEVTVQAGQEVTLELENRDTVEHDLEVEGLEVEVMEGGSERPEHGGEHGGGKGVLAVHTAGDESASITFMANDPGTYEFYCTIPGHKESGMVGTLTVQ